MDLGFFTTCMKDGETAERVRRDFEMGQAIGVTGTPALFVNGRRLTNAAELDTAIRDLLRSGQADAQPVR
jgi:protein-disulfide isomerase